MIPQSREKMSTPHDQRKNDGARAITSRHPKWHDIVARRGEDESHTSSTLGSLYRYKRGKEIRFLYVNIMVSACWALAVMPKGIVGGLEPPAPPDEEVTVAVEDFTESFTSRRNTDKF